MNLKSVLGSSPSPVVPAPLSVYVCVLVPVCAGDCTSTKILCSWGRGHVEVCPRSGILCVTGTERPI